MYLSYLFGTGIVGVSLYCYTLIGTLRRNLKRVAINDGADIVEKGYLISLVSIISCNFLYHYTLTAYQVILIIFMIVRSRKVRQKSDCINTIKHI